VLSSQNISLDNLTVAGLATAAGGALATAESGIYFKNDTNVSLTNSDLEFLGNAVTENISNNVTIKNNSFSNIYTDGIDGGGDSHVLIDGNTFTNFNIDSANSQHSDAIQFWTTNTTSSASDITITNNTFTRGTGGQAHGIFLGDESGTQLPYLNVLIANNSISGAGYDGISVYDGNNIQLIGNTVTSYSDQLSWMTVQNGNGIVSKGNSASSIGYTVADTNVTEAGDSIIPAIPVPVASSVALASAMAAFSPPGANSIVSSIPAQQSGALILAATR
jgi:parallel beta-helix repeat protein